MAFGRAVLATTGLLLAAGAPAGAATDTGMAKIHEWQKTGGRTCLKEHYHDGEASAATKPAAQAAAIRKWVEFTAWEYGTVWGSFAFAAAKSIDCTPVGSAWSCRVQARPCRRGR